MLQFLTSKKLLFVAVAILFLTWIIFLTFDNRFGETSAESFLRAAVTPLEHVFDELGDSAHGVLRTMGELYRLSAENRRLAEEIDRVAMENQTLRGHQMENVHLRAALDLRQRLPYELVAAEVLARDPSNWYSILTIGLGAADGIEGEMAVIAAGGVVGRVFAVREHQADILLLTDTRSQIGGMIERTGAYVLVRGDSGVPNSCQLLPYLDADFRRGDRVVTWEGSEYFPRGLVIGQVVSTTKGQGGIPHAGRLRLAVSPSQLDVVFVVKQADRKAEES